MPNFDDLSRTEAALVAHLETATRSQDDRARELVRTLVKHHVRLGASPEGTVVALKAVIARVHWPAHASSTHRRSAQGELVDWCIDEYFAHQQSGAQ